MWKKKRRGKNKGQYLRQQDSFGDAYPEIDPGQAVFGGGAVGQPQEKRARYANSPHVRGGSLVVFASRFSAVKTTPGGI